MVVNQIVIISGMSGAGKSSVSKALEDSGYFCIDNLPVILLPKFVELCCQSSGEINKVAIGMDLREPRFLDLYPEIFRTMNQLGYRLTLVFIDASTEVILRRFKETRRKHPLPIANLSLRDIIELEREKLLPLKQLADLVIDTTHTNIHELKQKVMDQFHPNSLKRRMEIHFFSFGYKYGLPFDADLVMDVRFLPNPYFSDSLKHLTGNDPAVSAYVFQSSITQKFIQKFTDLLEFTIPQYEWEGKAYLTLAVGCTGGKHRSVAVVNHLAEFFRQNGFAIVVTHRDINLK